MRRAGDASVSGSAGAGATTGATGASTDGASAGDDGASSAHAESTIAESSARASRSSTPSMGADATEATATLADDDARGRIRRPVRRSGLVRLLTNDERRDALGPGRDRSTGGREAWRDVAWPIVCGRRESEAGRLGEGADQGGDKRPSRR